jgi:hypothetical protein
MHQTKKGQQWYSRPRTSLSGFMGLLQTASFRGIPF